MLTDLQKKGHWRSAQDSKIDMGFQTVLTRDAQEQTGEQLKAILEYVRYSQEASYDKVRQFAGYLTKVGDRLAKTSEEIERLVLQIQVETNSVMRVMQGSTQHATEIQRTEETKRSLNNIIRMSDQIKNLVGSMPKLGSKQTETSPDVAQMVQSLELTNEDSSWENFDDDIIAGSEHEMPSAARYEFVQQRTYGNNKPERT
jgi:hypothetical protein